MKDWFLRALRAAGVFALARRLTAGKVRILCYHGVWNGPSELDFDGDALFMTAERFRSHLDRLLDGQYPVVSLDEAVDYLHGGEALPACSVVITIDDGWYSTYLKMWPALRERGRPATLFVDTGTLLSGRHVPHVMARYVMEAADAEDEALEELLEATRPGGAGFEERAEAARTIVESLGFDRAELHERRAFHYMSGEELREVHGDGLDVQLHTRSHLLVELTAEEVESDVEANREDLVELLERSPASFRHFCYPSGVHHPTMHEGLRRAGVVSATTQDRRLASPSDHSYELPRLVIGEGHTDLAFEAELSGVLDYARTIGHLARRWLPRRETAA